MYVLNPKDDNVLSFSSFVQKHLVEVGIPIYANKNGKTFFRKNNVLKKALRDAPIFIRLAIEGGVKNWAKH